MADIPRFGANDFYLVETSPLELREKLRDALSEVLGRSVLDSDPHMVLASAFLPFFVQGQASADAAAKATLRAFAVGADLDRIADSTCVVGYLDRLPASGAVLACALSLSCTRPSALSTEAVTVLWSAEFPVAVDGIVVTFSGSGEFAIDFAAGVSSRALLLPVYLTASETGAAFNGLFRDETGQMVEDNRISATVTATDSAGAACECSSPTSYRCGSTYNGSDIESDESFALRAAWQAKALRVPGALEYFRLALSRLRLLASCYVSPTVDSDGRIVMAWCDKAMYYALASSIALSDRGAAYDAFRRTVQDSLLVEQRVMAYPAREQTVQYTASYMLPSGITDVQSARAAVERAWRLFVAAHAWHCGAVLSIAEMCSVLIAAGAASVQIATAAAGYVVLPADTMQTDRYFSLVYSGLSTDSAAPVGDDGEEITP